VPSAAFLYVHQCFVTDFTDLFWGNQAPLASESYKLHMLRLLLALMSRDIQTILLLSHNTLVSFRGCSVSMEKKKKEIVLPTQGVEPS